MIRPGPPWIERNLAPGGIVVKAYALVGEGLDPVLLITRHLDHVADDDAALDDGELVARMIAAATPVVLVVYDGDTGERMKPQGLAGGR